MPTVLEKIILADPKWSKPWHELSSHWLVTCEFIEEHDQFHWDWTTIGANPNINIDFIRRHWSKFYVSYLSRCVNIHIILDNPDLSWDYKSVSANRSLTNDIILEYPAIPWDYRELSKNWSITWQLVEEQQDKPWNYFELTDHTDFQYIYANPQCEWDWHLLSNKCDINFIDEYPDKPWEWHMISQNTTITIDFIRKYQHKINFKLVSKFIKGFQDHLDLPWDYDQLSFNPNLTFDFVVKHLDRNWNWLGISKIASEEDIKNHPTMPWDKYQICYNPNLTPEFLLSMTDLKYPMAFSRSPNMTIGFMLKHPEIPWNYMEAYLAGVVNFEDVLKYPNLPWKWGLLSNVVHADDILGHPELPWDYSNIRYITLELLEKYPDKPWSYQYICQHCHKPQN